MNPIHQFNEREEKKRPYRISTREYARIHYWMRQNFGKASKCESKDCKGISKDYSWALKKGKEYECNRENFMELCKSCHSKYDQTPEGREKIRISSTGRRHSEEQKRKIGLRSAKCLKGRKVPMESRVKTSIGLKKFHLEHPKYSKEFIEKVNSLRENGMTLVKIGEIMGINHPEKVRQMLYSYTKRTNIPPDFLPIAASASSSMIYPLISQYDKRTSYKNS